jgi:hypothetical protein
MKYNRTLDLVASAVLAFQQGKPATAARAFLQAASHTDSGAAVRIINASNQKAVTASGRQRVSAASAWPFSVTASDAMLDRDEPGEGYRVGLEENGDRIFMEAEMEDEFGIDDDDGGDLDLMASEAGEDLQLDQTASARFGRYLRNAAAIEAAKKKAKSKRR